jgi:hypothetical protein
LEYNKYTLPDTSLSTKTTDDHAGAGVFSGAINASIAGLTAGTTYFLRAYAATSGGLVYSNVLQFTTAPPVAPTLTTNAATNVNSLSATSGGVIVLDGGAAITAKGVCWNTTTLPTLLITSQLMGLAILHTLASLSYTCSKYNLFCKSICNK